MRKKVRLIPEYATEDLVFRITPQSVTAAAGSCSDPTQCVIARALRRAIGPFFTMAHVGSTTTKIETSTTVVSYRTPKALSKALRIWDTTGVWTLPSGEYRLLAWHPTRAGWKRLRSKKKVNGKLNMSRAKKAPATRTVRRMDGMCSTQRKRSPVASSRRKGR